MNRLRSISPWHHVYYLTRPDFIKHDHIHKRKVEVLRAAGLKASLLSFVPRSLYEQRRADYENLASDGLRQVICVPGPEEVNQCVRKFFVRRLLSFKRLLVHVLLCDPSPVLRLKRVPVLGRRLKCVIEHEGDVASECLYRWAYNKYEPPPDNPPTEFQPTYNHLVAEQKAHLLEADGAILVTPDHLALWEQRLGRPLKALTLPTFFDPARFSFSAANRERLRSELGLHEKIVLVYSGSVSLEWQRFECVCQFSAKLLERGFPVRLLALVHADGHAAARSVIERYGLSASSHLLSAAAKQMAAYLSAADVALFLRHKHIMNRIVTSAKLGEYLAAGLPVVTTWACPYYRSFVEKHSGSLELPDALELPADFNPRFSALAAKGKDCLWRAQFSTDVKSTFSEENDPLHRYVEFVEAQLTGKNA